MSKFIHRFAMALAGSTLFLIFAGGLVNTTHSSLSVPDWPLSYGQLMPPMVGGVFFEHGHRMIATGVGFLTILMAVFLSRGERRSWVRKMGWLALGLVILQGILGGLTVLLLLPKPISIAHACLAQTFFSLVVSLAVWTSNFWTQTAQTRTELAGRTPLHRLSLALFAASYVQLILGAILRHSGKALPLHIVGALIVLSLSLWIVRRIYLEHREIIWLKRLAFCLLFALILQLSLGGSTYLLLHHRFDTIPPPFWSQVVITLHVVGGALLLALAVILSLTTYHTRPKGSSNLRSTLADYFTLTKPGISMTAAITAFAGFLLGCQGTISYIKLFHTCIGTLLAAAGAGCLNMLMEKEVDQKMKRTRSRPLPSGRLESAEVLFLGTFFWAGGVLYLAWSVNFMTAFLAGLTVSIYLYLYTPLKKISSLCISVGAVAGALPPVMGWTAATNSLSIAPLSLFGILFFWQFPHFISLAWLYKDDYSGAGLHMLPQMRGQDSAAAKSILFNSIALFFISLAPLFLGLVGPFYLVPAMALGAGMVFYSARFYRSHERQEAKRVFLFSLAYIPLLVGFLVWNGPTSLWTS